MTLDILICTIDEGIANVARELLPPADGIRWTVSMQYTDRKKLALIPSCLLNRSDVTFTTLFGRGLSRNRNHAISLAQGDILLIADDDCQYSPERLQAIITAYKKKPEADIICFAAETLEGLPMKNYPKVPMTYRAAFEAGYYPSSVEMTMRRGLGLRFDERFGLGSEKFCAGEEMVFMKDAEDSGLNCFFMPHVIVATRKGTTGEHFIGNKTLQQTKGATFRYAFGPCEAIWRTVKEAGWWFVHKGANPFPILYNMLRGIWILR